MCLPESLSFLQKYLYISLEGCYNYNFQFLAELDNAQISVDTWEQINQVYLILKLLKVIKNTFLLGHLSIQLDPRVV